MPQEYGSHLRTLTYRGRSIGNERVGKEIIDPEDMCIYDDWDDEERDEAYWDSYLKEEEEL